MQIPVPITVVYGNGTGPEIMEAALRVLREAGAKLTVESIEAGERLYSIGAVDGIWPDAWDSLKRTRLLLKAPTRTPHGYERVKDIILAQMLPDAAFPYDRFAELASMEPFHMTITDALAGIGQVLATARAYVGDGFALFEPQGDAPTLSDMLLASVMMLEHIGHQQTADLIYHGWLKAIEDRTHLEKDITAQGFAEQVILRLGKKPSHLPTMKCTKIPKFTRSDNKTQENHEATVV